MPTISIIVPVYNVEQYLEQCVQSLLDQTYTDIEILLMEDGSTDDSPEICDSFAEKDRRVKAFHLEHGGISAARNRGIENASGDYLMFTDGDDWVEPDFCKVPMETAVREKADIVMFGFYREGRTCEMYSRPDHRGEVPYAERFVIFEDLASAYAWNKLYRRELFEDVRFPEGYTYEDIPVAYRILHASGKFIYLDDMLYHYRTREGSITWTKTHEKENDHYDTGMMAVNDLLSWGLRDEAEKLRFDTCFTYILRMDTRGKYSKECAGYFRSAEYRKDVQSWRARMMVRAFLFFPPLFRAISAHFGDNAQN